MDYVAEVARLVGADSVGYLSVDRLLSAVGEDRDSYCATVFPVPLAEEGSAQAPREGPGIDLLVGGDRPTRV